MVVARITDYSKDRDRRQRYQGPCREVGPVCVHGLVDHYVENGAHGLLPKPCNLHYVVSYLLGQKANWPEQNNTIGTILLWRREKIEKSVLLIFR